MLTVSRVQDGVAGIRDVALSLPAVVGAGGAPIVVEPEMSAEEADALRRSAEVLRARRTRGEFQRKSGALLSGQVNVGSSHGRFLRSVEYEARLDEQD